MEKLHDAALRRVELVGGPQTITPLEAVEVRWLLRVLGKLYGDDDGREDDELGPHRIDVQHLLLGSLVEGRRWGQGMALRRWHQGIGGERAREPPGSRELGVEAVEDAYGEGDGFEGEVRAGEERLNEGHGCRSQRGGRRDEIDEMDGGSCNTTPIVSQAKPSQLLWSTYLETWP